MDGDEYFYPVHMENIGCFFDQFEHADGVAVSWCIYGSSDRVVRPRNTTVEAFRAHSTTELGDNSLVKSFVRPEKLGPNYTDPHRFDIPEERYVDTKGQQVVWNGAIKNIDWDDAKILHYICRSMEHYIQRIKRRINADLGDSQVYWNHCLCQRETSP
ncbi:hypothetical protein [Entomobacter blattae]|uniref:Glycosyltransferase family 92 protein n=1 Tax=Entomobacter blattae TaxID=2762277 RepID=A0A7H1NPD9_9PROT|nr:hypothetical protein [Entomobacter blattae]QNT77649.1 hypothetical protein JGUZn3_03980 [Entomobacter blattae]